MGERLVDTADRSRGTRPGAARGTGTRCAAVTTARAIGGQAARPHADRPGDRRSTGPPDRSHQALVDGAVLGVDRDDLGPGVCRAAWTTGAPAMSDSLLARASRRPAPSAASVTGSPAKPTTALTTRRPPWPTATSPRRRPSPRSPAAARPPASGTRAGSPMATSSGRSRRAWATSRSTDRWAASATNRKRSGSVSTTSIAWVPIEPVEPTRLTLHVTRLHVHGPQHAIGRAAHPAGAPTVTAPFTRGGTPSRGRTWREDEQQAVHPVEHAPVAGQDPAHVLQPEVPLDERLAQVADREPRPRRPARGGRPCRRSTGG